MGKCYKKRGHKNGGKTNGNGKPAQEATMGKATPTTAPKAAIGLAAAPSAAKAAAQLPAQGRVPARQNLFARDFSHVTAVLMRAPNYKNLRISDLEWLVIPPLLAGQSKVALSRFQKDGPIVPVAVALWARVSENVDKRLSENPEKAPMLRATDWTSGTIFWLIALAGEPKALAQFLPQLQATVFKGRPVKMRMQSKDGKTVVQTLQAPAPVKGLAKV